MQEILCVCVCVFVCTRMCMGGLVLGRCVRMRVCLVWVWVWIYMDVMQWNSVQILHGFA